MKCCVNGCCNDSTNIANSREITFYVFPNALLLQTPYLNAMGVEILDSNDVSAICSNHVVCDLNLFYDDLKKFNLGAVPITLQDCNNYVNRQDTTTMKVCRICLLSSYGRMYSLKLNNLQQAYEDLTGFRLEDEDHLPQKLCAECAARLVSHSRFRSRSLRAHSVMTNILQEQHYLTRENLAKFSRQNHLRSQLKVKNYEVDYYDMHIVEYEEELKEGEMIDTKEEGMVGSQIESESVLDKDVTKSDMKGDDEDYNEFDTTCLSDDNELGEGEKRVTEIEAEVDDKENVEVSKGQNKPEKLPTKPSVLQCQKELGIKPSYIGFTVAKLSRDEQIQYFEEKQESSVYKNGLFRCTDCYRGFIDEDAYERHIVRHTDQYGLHECRICKLHFKSKVAVYRHVSTNHTHRFSCNECLYTTMNSYAAKLHARWHKGTKYSCAHCPEKFEHFTTYLSHKRLVHPSDFICELCGCAFVSTKGLAHHKKLKHRFVDSEVPDDGPYCELCDLRFISAMAFERHLYVSAKHNGREITKGNRSVTSTRWKVKKRNIADIPVTCEQCGEKTVGLRAYHYHFSRMHPDKNRTKYPTFRTAFMCELCGKILPSAHCLKNHRRIHTGERPFVCDQCDKSFISKDRLMFHIQLHAKTRKLYQCDQCGKEFTTNGNRIRHMAVSTARLAASVSEGTN